MHGFQRPKTISTEFAEYIFKISLDSIYMEYRAKGISLARFCKLAKRNCGFLLNTAAGPAPVKVTTTPRPHSKARPH